MKKMGSLPGESLHFERGDRIMKAAFGGDDGAFGGCYAICKERLYTGASNFSVDDFYQYEGL
jgi:hypothetical protein